MGQINTGRMILGGLLAGLIMNCSEFVLHAIVLRQDGVQLVADFKQHGIVIPEDPTNLMILVGITFALGLLALWTYAAIRPRLGPGPKTAICAGLTVWAMSYFYSGVYVHAAFVIFPAKIVWIPVAWSLLEVPVATLAGAAIYKE